jgi:hypothetical protein
MRFSTASGKTGTMCLGHELPLSADSGHLRNRDRAAVVDPNRSFDAGPEGAIGGS